jgi:NADPH-dependent 2,4-dienoyl-CoA reductase/sulfur reductase-like enzyme
MCTEDLYQVIANALTTVLSHKRKAKLSIIPYRSVQRLQYTIIMSTGSHDYLNVHRVAIVGAGVTGLQAADELAKVGIKEVVIFDEGSDRVGGVWRENYAGYGLQVPNKLYEFPGFSSLPGSKFSATLSDLPKVVT